MKKACLVHSGQRCQNALQQRDHTLRRNWLGLRPQDVVQCLAGQQLHDRIGRIICFEERDDPHDPWSAAVAAKGGKQARLGQKTPATIDKDLLIGFRGGDDLHPDPHRKLSWEEFLDGKELFQQIGRPIGNTEAATPKDRKELIAIQHCPVGQGVSMFGSRRPWQLWVLDLCQQFIDARPLCPENQ